MPLPFRQWPWSAAYSYHGGVERGQRRRGVTIMECYLLDRPLGTNLFCFLLSPRASPLEGGSGFGFVTVAGATFFCNSANYLGRMFKTLDFCLPIRSTTVPDGPDWFHEIKCDGYRLRLERDGERVRLITRGGYNWTDRYPWIVESALKNRPVRHRRRSGGARRRGCRRLRRAAFRPAQ